MEHKPGDVVNGHILGSDGTWHPLGKQQQPPGPQSSPTLVIAGHQLRLGDDYGKRYLRRLPFSALAVGLSVFAIFWVGMTVADELWHVSFSDFVASILQAFLCPGLFVGSIVNVLVAAVVKEQAEGTN